MLLYPREVGRIADIPQRFTHTERALSRRARCAGVTRADYYMQSVWFALALDGIAGGVPGHRGLPEVRLVGHVARRCGMVSENGVLHHGFASADSFEIVPQVRRLVVVRRDRKRVVSGESAGV